MSASSLTSADGAAELHRQGLVARLDRQGQIAEVRDLVTGHLLAQSVTLSFPAPWVAEPDRAMCWRCEGATVQADWQVSDDDLRLVVVLTADQTVSLPGPTLEVIADWPVQRVAIGPRHSALLIDPRRNDGAVLALAAHHRPGDWAHRLDGSALLVQASRLPRQLSWQATWVQSRADFARLLPPWFPPTTTGESGDEVALALPDAGVEVEGEGHVVAATDDGAMLVFEPGAGCLVVHEPSGTSEVQIWGRVPAEPADLDLAHEPAPGEIVRALAQGESSRGSLWPDAEAALEESMHRPGELDPLVVVAAASLLTQTGASSHHDLMVEASARMAPTPGCVLAHARACVASTITGLALPAPLTPHVADRDGVLATSLRAEVALLSGVGQPTPDVRAMTGLLGRGLPVRDLDVQVVAPWLALLRARPEHWTLGDDWLVPLSELLDALEIRLRAEHVGSPALGWLEV